LDFLQNDYPSEWRLFMIRRMRLLPLVCLTLLIQQPSSFASASGPGSSTTQAAAGQAAAGGQQKAGGSQSGGPSAASQPSSSNAYFESQMLAYGAMTQLSANIAARVCSELTNSQPLVMFDQASFQNLQAWQAFEASSVALEETYRTFLTDDKYQQIMKRPTPIGKRRTHSASSQDRT
jgi:hypothetical protein